MQVEKEISIKSFGKAVYWVLDVETVKNLAQTGFFPTSGFGATFKDLTFFVLKRKALAEPSEEDATTFSSLVEFGPS